jgi:hypothetical protein
MYIEVKALPPVVQSALDSVGYGRKDIEVTAGEFAYPMQGDAGQRGFMTVINLATGEFRTAQGSYGGANPFQKSVDDIDSVALQPGMMVITGVSGYGPVYASITAHPSNMAAMLPAGPTLSQRELTVLYAFRALKGGEARRDHFRRYEVKQSEIDALEAKGLIKVNKAGAAQITTEGRNSFPTPLWSPPPSRLYGMSGGAWSPPWSR